MTFGPSLVLRQGPALKTLSDQLDLLGHQLRLALEFQRSGFDKNLSLWDRTTDSQTTAGELFAQTGNRYFMRDESIPGSLAIKAIAVDQRVLLLESSPPGIEQIAETIIDEQLQFKLAFDGDRSVGLSSRSNRKVLVWFGNTVKPSQELGARTLNTIPLAKLKPEQADAAIFILDRLYTAGVFPEDDTVEVDSGGPRGGMQQRMELNISLRQMLTLEQRPLLSLADRTEMRTELNLGTAMLIATEHKILQMNPELLPEYFAQLVVERGEACARRIMTFTLAGRIKREVYPHMGWPQIRQYAGRLMRKMQQK